MKRAFCAVTPVALTSALILGGLALGLTACQPPKASDRGAANPDGGRLVVDIPQRQPALGPYALREIDGVEYHISRDPVGQPGGTLLDASIGDGPKTFNPWVSKDSTSSDMGGKISEGLVTSDPGSGAAIPALAKSVTLDADRCTYRVVLRKGLRWSDGRPLTSADVAFTWNDIIRPGLGNASLRDLVMVDGQFPEVRALDPLTLEFKTAKPFAPFIRRLGYPIAPKHIFDPIVRNGGEKAFNEAWGNDDAARHPEKFVSAGLWVLDRYEPAMQRVLFRRNPYYAMRDANGTPLPYIERLAVSFVSDMNNLMLQFEQGKVDVYGVDAQYVSHVRRLTQPAFTLYNLGMSDAKQFLTFNLSARPDPTTGQQTVDPARSAWFNNLAFRKAVDWALNRQDIADNIFKGLAQPSFTAESPASPFLNEALAAGHPQDLAQAREWLKKGGFRWNDAGKLIDSQGRRVAFEVLTNVGNEQREAMGANIVGDLAKLGMEAQLKPINFNVLTSRLDSGQWDAIILGLGGGSPLEPHDGVNVWRSDGALHMFNQRSKNKKTGVIDLSDRLPWEAQLDEIFEKGARAFDPAERRAIYNQYQQLVADQLPFIYLISPYRFIAVRTRLQNVRPTPLGGVTHNLESLWLKAESAPSAATSAIPKP